MHSQPDPVAAAGASKTASLDRGLSTAGALWRQHHRYGRCGPVYHAAADRDRHGRTAGNAGLGAGRAAFAVRWMHVERARHGASHGRRLLRLPARSLRQALGAAVQLSVCVAAAYLRAAVDCVGLHRLCAVQRVVRAERIALDALGAGDRGVHRGDAAAAAAHWAHWRGDAGAGRCGVADFDSGDRGGADALFRRARLQLSGRRVSPGRRVLHRPGRGPAGQRIRLLGLLQRVLPGVASYARPSAPYRARCWVPSPLSARCIC